MDNTASNLENRNAFAAHQKWGGTYLVVADESEEFHIALKYAVRMANANKCRIGVFYTMQGGDFMHWGNIQKRLADDQRAQAEEVLTSACYEVEDCGGDIPALYLTEGNPVKALANAIDNDPSISMLILAGGTSGKGPGPLVSYFTGKGFSRLGIPVLVVPDHFDL